MMGRTESFPVIRRSKSFVKEEKNRKGIWGNYKNKDKQEYNPCLFISILVYLYLNVVF
jgi:hypothetical protein